MIEKVRISLWDLFTFFLSGFLLAILVLAHLIYLKRITPSRVNELIIALPATQALILPLAFTLAGMLLEPIANYFDSLILKPIYDLGFQRKDKHKAEEDVMRDEVKKYLGNLSEKIDNPYHFCKEYVETKQLSTTFMVFLSRYGFYRNVAFLCSACAISSALLASSFCSRVLLALIWLLGVFIFKRRAEDFYSYMAPAVYRAFLTERISVR